jgi:hypothetical protein
MVDPAVQAAILASAIAAGATVSGYLVTQSRARKERRATVFAEALTALRRYQDFPYKIWRRTDDGPETRARLLEEQSVTGMQTNFHLSWLQVDAPVVGEAFESLVAAVRTERRANYHHAWQSPPITDSSALGVPPPFQRHGAEPELQLCLLAMRNEMSLLAPLRRRRIRERIQVQARTRAIDQARSQPHSHPAPAAAAGP